MSTNALAHPCTLLLLSQPVTQMRLPRSGEPGPTRHTVEAELSAVPEARGWFGRPTGPLIWMAGAEMLVRNVFVSKSTVNEPSRSPSCLNMALVNVIGSVEATVTRGKFRCKIQ